MCYQSKRLAEENEALFHEACQLLAHLEKAGYQAYIVGGAVRDALLKRKVNDLDIATSATPGEVQSLFPRTVPTGLTHGTVTVISGQFSFEVTTFRGEGPYGDARRPDYVYFVDHLTTDLARRDFTINALAYRCSGEIVDPFKGRADLQKKLIRCVGKAEERFQEDALRILRGIRIAAQLAFEVEPRTLRAMRTERAGLEKLAVERVTSELDKLLSAPRPGKALKLLWTAQLLTHIQPLVSYASTSIRSLPDEEVFIQLDREWDTGLRWVLFLKMCGIPVDEARSVFRRFKMSGKAVSELALLWQKAAHWPRSSLSAKHARRLVFSFGLERLLKIIRLTHYFGTLNEKQWLQLRRQFCHADWDLPIEEASQLALDGHTMMRVAGREPGPWIGEVRRALLQKVIAGELNNHPEQLQREWCTHGPHAP